MEQGRIEPPPYMCIEGNEFSYRKHKKLKEEDIAVCDCHYDVNDLESACGERCLNVLTSTECTPGYCCCGEYCRNQRFQKCQYAKTRLVKTEGRGWGLLADENIKAGQFVIEYCGEVISWKEARRRSQAYETQGLKDAYIIYLNTDESIDATRKGSLARFINHSCQPNCETRKWTVLGEVRVGIFAKQEIPIGTELSYDYNFEWFGGVMVRCLCGAGICSGFLGAKSRGFQEAAYLWEDDDDRFKYGHWLASLGGGSRPHYNIVAVAVGLGIGVAGLCKVLYNGLGMPWATRKKDSSELERVYHIGGLHNLGNNCFLNVILQALASCNSFISFLNNLLETDGTLLEEKAKRMPLIFALSSLLEDLCIIQDERTVLNPRRVMHALSFYVNHFNLTRQQDASEAFIHLLTSLRDESCLCYVPYRSSLADITLSPSKVYKQREGNQPECKRWKQNLFGPFDGTIGSILSCRNCSCVLSMDYENFHCLPLSPVLDISGDIINGCNLVDCLKYFTDVEHLDSYRCDRCWHIAAAKHLSLRPNVDEEKVNKLHACVNYDTCNCMVMFDADEIPCCSSSHALKQLVITQCPKILCIHLQRATVGQNGDLLKLEGHISFPLLLNLSPFVGATSTLREGPLAINIQRQGHQAHHLYWQLNMQMPLHMFPAGRHPSNQPSNNEVTSNGSNPLYKEANVNVAGSSSSTRSKLYSLSAVVEHYGRCGGGHYAAYRRVTPDSGDADPAQPLASSGGQWFYVSDHHVSHISEDAVLAAEATLLFYERL